MEVLVRGLVVNTASNAVVNKNPDRHKDKEARKVYLREYMRKKRAKT
jgi:hypothetical protein